MRAQLARAALRACPRALARDGPAAADARPRANGAAVELRLDCEREHRLIAGSRLPTGRTPAPRNDDPRRVRRDGIEQLDLHAHDRVETRLVRGGRKPDRAIQALVIGQGEAGQPQLEGALDKILDARGTIEEREIGVAVELGEGTSAPVDNRTYVLESKPRDLRSCAQDDGTRGYESCND